MSEVRRASTALDKPMFVSTPPQISAEAAQTDLKRPSAPADAGNWRGFCVPWLCLACAAGAKRQPGAAPLKALKGSRPQPQFSPFWAGSGGRVCFVGQPNQAGTESSAFDRLSKRPSAASQPAAATAAADPLR